MAPISTTPELASLCRNLSSADFIAVDTEFMREQTYYPKLCLIQLASPDAAATIDQLARDLDLKPLW